MSVNVPVAIIFYNRPEPLKAVFDAVKKARPTKLFLIQDGPREGNAKDSRNIAQCREVVSNVDWACEVLPNYEDQNLGCGHRVYSGLSWVFEHVDRAIILEDDCVPSQSFFRFSAELLEKYKEDQRVSQICGMNHLEVYSGTRDSYFFSNTGSCWGWATWKRAWDQVEFNMPYINDPDTMSLFAANYLRQKSKSGRDLYAQGKRLRRLLSRGERLSAWTYQFNMTKYLFSQFNIVSKYNMIRNIGLTAESTHTPDSYKLLPRGVRDVYFMRTYDIEFPLSHPKYFIVDDRYEEKVNKMMGYGFWRSKIKRGESILRRLVYG